MSTLASSGHGCEWAIELDPENSPGVFTAVAQLVGDVNTSLMRSSEESTPHNATIDEYITSNVITRDEATYNLNYVHGHATHTAADTSLRAKLINDVEFGMRFRGPGGVEDSDEWICTGGVTKFENKNPARTGARAATVTVRYSGPMIVDGESIGIASS